MIGALLVLLSVGDVTLPLPGPPTTVVIERYRVEQQRVSTSRSAVRRRNAGWALAAVGVAAFAGSAVLISQFYTSPVTSTDYFNNVLVPEYLSGIALAAIGIAITIPGIVLALQGQLDVSEEVLRPTPRVSLVPTRGGAMVGLGFAY